MNGNKRGGWFDFSFSRSPNFSVPRAIPQKSIPVKAREGGKIVLAEEVPDYGKSLVIEHPDKTYSAFHHLDDFGEAQLGDEVKPGQVVALMQSHSHPNHSPRSISQPSNLFDSQPSGYHRATSYGPYDPRPEPRNWPVDGYPGEVRLSSPFGDRVLNGKPDFHPGMDFAVPSGTPVKATMDGEIVHSDALGDYGLTVPIEHPNKYYSKYAHLTQTHAKVGQMIKAGDIIGYSGGDTDDPNSGKSTGPHLHYEIAQDKFLQKGWDRRFDPNEWHNREK